MDVQNPPRMARICPPALVAPCLGALLVALLGGCANRVMKPVQPRYALSDPDPAKRLRAVRQIVAAGDTRYLDQLVELLEDRDPTVRFVAAKALARLTGRPSGTPTYEGPDAHRAEADAWRTWLATRGALAPGGAP